MFSSPAAVNIGDNCLTVYSFRKTVELLSGVKTKIAGDDVGDYSRVRLQSDDDTGINIGEDPIVSAARDL